MVDPTAPAGGRPVSAGEALLLSIVRGEDAATAFLECPLHMSVVARLRGRLNDAALRQALGTVVRRHRVLGSRFHDTADGFRRTVTGDTDAPVLVVDLRGLASDARREELAVRLVAAHVERAFELDGGALLRVMLMRLADDAHLLAVVVHHLVFDAGSRTVLLRELEALYTAAAEGRAAALPAIGEGYESYVAWQRARLEPAREAALFSAWRSRLLPAPPARPRPDRDGEAGGAARTRFVMGTEEVAAVRRLARELRVTAAAVLLALFARFVRDRSDGDDLLVGLPSADRRRRDFEDMLGLFANVMLVRLSARADESFPSLVRTVWQGLLAAIAEQDLPYARFLQLSKAQGLPAPVLRVAFNFMSAASDSMTLPGVAVDVLALGQEPPCLVDVALVVADRGATFACELVHAVARFSPMRVASDARAFQSLAAAVLGEIEPSLRT